MLDVVRWCVKLCRPLFQSQYRDENFFDCKTFSSHRWTFLRCESFLTVCWLLSTFAKLLKVRNFHLIRIKVQPIIIDETQFKIQSSKSSPGESRKIMWISSSLMLMTFWHERLFHLALLNASSDSSSRHWCSTSLSSAATRFDCPSSAHRGTQESRVVGGKLRWVLLSECKLDIDPSRAFDRFVFRSIPELIELIIIKMNRMNCEQLTFGCQMWKIPGSVVRMTLMLDRTYLR